MMATEISQDTHELEVEYVLLAGLLNQNDRIDAVADILTQEDFAEPFYGHLYGLIVAERSRGHAINPLTLRSLIIDHPSFEEVGGNRFIANLGSALSLVAPVSNAETIVRNARRRRLLAGIKAAHNMPGEATVEEIIDVADAAITAAADRTVGLVEVSAEKALANLAESYNHPLKGVTSTTIASLDGLLGPLRPKQLCILAARPGMGKSAVALSYATGVAQGGAGVLFVSLEMSADELCQRMAADLSFNGQGGTTLDDIIAGRSRDALRAIDNAGEMMRDYAFNIIDAGSLTVGRLNMIVRRYKRRLAAKGLELGLVVVDYLQLLRTDDRHRSNYEVVSEISRSLKAIAKDHDVAVMALAQLSREVEKRTDKVPQLSDLRDSGQIEQDADAVLFLVRDEYYLRQNEPEEGTEGRDTWEAAMEAAQGKIEFIVAKRRQGRTGRAQGQFHARYQAVR